MAKAVLIMDMPETCFGCNFCNFGFDEEDTCQAYEKVRKIDSDTYEKPDWCPLLELPKHRNATGPMSAERLLLNAGYNDCLDEILKRKE